MLEIFYNRRSTRKFLDLKIEDEKIQKLLAAGLLAPSSKEHSPLEFIIVNDIALLELLAKSKPHAASLLKHAPLAIIIAGDKAKSNEWLEDCSSASLFIQLEAESLGLGYCWIQINGRYFNDEITSNEYIHKHFNMPDRLEVLSIIGIGYKATERPPLTDHDLQWDKISVNRYKSKF
ncbi:MAG: nitroreductase family protein [Mariniphaga sp.]